MSCCILSFVLLALLKTAAVKFDKNTKAASSTTSIPVPSPSPSSGMSTTTLNATTPLTPDTMSPSSNMGGSRTIEPTTTHTVVPPSSTVTTQMPVERKFKTKLKFKAMTWESALSKENSSEYNTLKDKINNELNITFQSDSSYKGAVNHTFTEGSVIAIFVMLFGPVDSASRWDPETVLKQKVSKGEFGKMKVDPASLTVTEKIEGVTLGNWTTNDTLCKEKCCGATPNQIPQYRQCTASTTRTCYGVLIGRELKCEESLCKVEEICNDAMTLHAVTALALLLSVVPIVLAASL